MTSQLDASHLEDSNRGAWAGPIPSPSPAELADRYAVSQLVKVYALGVDLRDYDLCRSVFTDDAVADGSVGSFPIDEYLPKVHGGAAAYAATQHNVTNQHVVIDGDTATCWSYAIAVHKHAAGVAGEQMTLGVQYRDLCRRTPEGWLIARRKVVRVWNEFTPNDGRAV
ncbi:nuclear transport factor 2 family protein [Novosphingobium bradum]|uniref:Nuclear transport factor 2 family protein n=1 Tax=Novosphingobium bradum TaxID=1737444 RepID=A0ABV7IJJ0_9SPHN